VFNLKMALTFHSLLKCSENSLIGFLSSTLLQESLDLPYDIIVDVDFEERIESKMRVKMRAESEQNESGMRANESGIRSKRERVRKAKEMEFVEK